MGISGHFFGTSGEIYLVKTAHTVNLTTYPEKREKVYFCAILKTKVAENVVYCKEGCLRPKKGCVIWKQRWSRWWRQ